MERRLGVIISIGCMHFTEWNLLGLIKMYYCKYMFAVDELKPVVGQFAT